MKKWFKITQRIERVCFTLVLTLIAILAIISISGSTLAPVQLVISVISYPAIAGIICMVVSIIMVFVAKSKGIQLNEKQPK
jgi:uncharacterized integral membrane protein